MNRVELIMAYPPVALLTLAQQFAARGFGPPAADQSLTFGNENQYAK